MKICIKCKQEKDFSDYHLDKTRTDGHNPYCKMCKCAYNRNLDQKNSEPRKLRTSIWKKEHKEKQTSYNLKWQKANKDKLKVIQKRTEKKAIDTISDRYIKHNLLRSISNVPSELIDLKRAQIQLNRELKQMEQQP